MPTDTENQRKANLERRQRGAEMDASEEEVEGSSPDEEISMPSDPDDAPRTGPRISPIEGFFMLATALVFDGMDLLLGLIFLGFLVTFLAWLTFYVWFHVKGMGFSKKLWEAIKKGDMMSMGKSPTVINAVAALIGAIPVINALPQYTFGILLVILLEYADFYMGKIGVTALSKKAAAQ